MLKTIKAEVIDTNHKPRGRMLILVEFVELVPVRVEHAGRIYYYTGKQGINRQTGKPAREMATNRDERLWITFDGQLVNED